MVRMQLATRVKRLEAWYQRPQPVAYPIPELPDEYWAQYCAEVWALLLKYGLYESEAALAHALEQQISAAQ